MKIKFLAAIVLLVSNQAFAATQLVEITKGTTNDITVAPGSAAKLIDVAYMSRTNDPSALKLTLTGPKGTSVSVKAVGVAPGSTVANAYPDIKSGYQVEVTPFFGKYKKSHAVGSTPSGGGSTAGKYKCNGQLLSMFYDHYVKAYKATFGSAPATETDLCKFLFAGYVDSGTTPETPVVSANTLSLTGRFIKDLCTKKDYDYLAVATIDLSKVSASDMATGFTLSISMDESIWAGKDAASIKPKSDGRYAPQPGLMADTIDTKAQLLVARFKSGRIATTKSIVSLPNKKTLAWQGHILNFYLIGPQLTGGKASIYTSSSNDLSAPGCFTMVRKRQSTPGY